MDAGRTSAPFSRVRAAPRTVALFAALVLGACGDAVRTASVAAPRPEVTALPAPIPGPDAGSNAAAVPPETVPEGASGSYPDDDPPEDVDDEMAGVTDTGDRVAHPLDGWTDARLEEALLADPTSLGPMSIGTPNFGALFNGVQMPVSERWELVDPANAWGTQETIDALERAIDAVHTRFPGSPRLYLGHVSARRGGPLSPHVSHQAGRDVDVSYFYLDGHRWYARATATNLDRARTWAFVRALITDTDVELLLIDASIQRLLREHATSIGEDEAWLEDVFRGTPGRRRALVLHAKGHATHLHVRFASPFARETARRVYPLLVRHGLIEPLTRVVTYRARRGDTLGKLARRHGTTIAAIQRANGLRTTKIRAGRTYRLPMRVPYQPPAAPVSVPPRRLPPTAPAP